MSEINLVRIYAHERKLIPLIFKNQWYWANSGVRGWGVESMFFNVDVYGGSNQGTSNIATLILV